MLHYTSKQCLLQLFLLTTIPPLVLLAQLLLYCLYKCYTPTRAPLDVKHDRLSAQPYVECTAVKPSNDVQVNFLRMALNHRFTEKHLIGCFTRGEVPIFVSGPLMFPQVIGVTAGSSDYVAVVQKMTPAVLKHHIQYVIQHANRPALLPSTNPNAEVHGMLLLGFSQAEFEKIDQYVGMDLHEKDIAEVEIVLSNSEKRVVAAYIYIWTGAISLLQPGPWRMEEYLRSTAKHKPG